MHVRAFGNARYFEYLGVVLNRLRKKRESGISGMGGYFFSRYFGLSAMIYLGKFQNIHHQVI